MVRFLHADAKLADFIPQFVDFARLGSQPLQFFVRCSVLIAASSADRLLCCRQFLAQRFVNLLEAGDSPSLDHMNCQTCQEQTR